MFQFLQMKNIKRILGFPFGVKESSILIIEMDWKELQMNKYITYVLRILQKQN